jgi:hypothetical protein
MAASATCYTPADIFVSLFIKYSSGTVSIALEYRSFQWRVVRVFVIATPSFVVARALLSNRFD